MKPEMEGAIAYSNFDHTFNLSEEEIKDSACYHQHAAWNFCGYVWFDKEKNLFIEEVWRYKTIIKTYEDESLSDLIETVNEKWGYE